MKIKQIIAVALCMMMPGLQVYAKTGAGTQAMNASVTPSGGQTTWDVKLKNVSNNVEVAITTPISWTGVSAGMPSYKVANQYVELTKTITNPINWRMLIYTNNTTYTGDKSKGSYGLVGTNTAQGLPLAWKVVESTVTINTPVFSVSRSTGPVEGFTDYMWKYIVDKTQTGDYAWDPADTYVRVWDSSGFYWNEGTGPGLGPDQSIDNKVCVYIAAGFADSLAQNYSTSSLTIEVLVL